MCKKQLWAVDRAGARRKRLERWKGGGGRRVQDGCSCVQMEGQHWIIVQKKKKKTDLRSRTCRYQAPLVHRHLSARHKSSYPSKWNWYVKPLFPPPPPSPLCLPLFFVSSLLMRKRRVFGSYLDNKHVFPRSPSCFRGGSSVVALPLRQPGTQLCPSHSAQHYLVTAAASLGLCETKSSQSQLSLLLNSFLFSVVFFTGASSAQRKPIRLKRYSLII